MKVKLVLLSAFVVLAAAAMALAAAKVDGKWTAQVPGRGGQTRETTFMFKADGDKLTGTVSGRQGDDPITEGKISGDDISFKVALSFNGQSLTLAYKGKVSGDEIKFVRTRDGADTPGQEFTAKRAN